MPDSMFRHDTEIGDVVPVNFRGEAGGYVLAMYLDCGPPIAAGREILGISEKLWDQVFMWRRTRWLACCGRPCQLRGDDGKQASSL